MLAKFPAFLAQMRAGICFNPNYAGRCSRRGRGLMGELEDIQGFNPNYAGRCSRSPGGVFMLAAQFPFQS